MASRDSSLKLRLRRTWFQLHKWIGLVLAILIIPLSLSGSLLVWDEWVNNAINPQRHAASSPSKPPAFYAAAARKALAPAEALTSLTYPEGPGPVVASAIGSMPPGPPRGRPSFVQLYLDPADGRLLDRSSGGGLVRFMHELHESLMLPGVGRTVVGIIGVGMLISSLTGLWLWWPFSGSFASGFRWRRAPVTSGNLHHLFGFWISLPLFVLSLTGAWISFPSFFAALSGDSARAGGPPGGGRLRFGPPLAETSLTPDQALAAATPLASGTLRSIGWPSGRDAQWSISFGRNGAQAEVKVDDATGMASPPDQPRPETTARLMRRVHDGTRMGPVWQTIIFLGGLIPAGLAVTGVLMWLADRKRRAQRARNREVREAAV